MMCHTLKSENSSECIWMLLNLESSSQDNRHWRFWTFSAFREVSDSDYCALSFRIPLYYVLHLQYAANHKSSCTELLVQITPYENSLKDVAYQVKQRNIPPVHNAMPGIIFFVLFNPWMEAKTKCKKFTQNACFKVDTTTCETSYLRSGGASIEGARAPPLLEFFVQIIIKKRAKIWYIKLFK